MNILYIVPYDPALDITGATYRSRMFVNYLARCHRVYLVCMDGSGHSVDRNIIKNEYKNKRLDDSIQVYRVAFSKIRYFIFCREIFSKACSLIEQNSIDIVITDYGLAVLYGLLLQHRYGIGYVYLSHNTEYLEYLKRVPNDLTRLFFVPYVYLIEMLGYKMALLVVFISMRDKERLKRWVVPEKSIYIPQGFSPLLENPFYFYEGKVGADYILFYGSFKSRANYEACRIIRDKIMPVVIKRYPHLHCLLIGQSPPRNITHPNMKYIGFVENLSKYIRNACCVIVPIRLGGGMSTKIIKALALGKHVVATPSACDWLEEPHPLLHVCSIDTFAVKIIDIVERGEYVSEQGFELMEKNFSWEKKLSEFDAKIQEITVY